MTPNYPQEAYSGNRIAVAIFQHYENACNALDQSGHDLPIEVGEIEDGDAPWKEPFMTLLELIDRKYSSLTDDDLEMARLCLFDIQEWLATQ